jgi:exodeoxyribonuclease-5
MIVPTQQQSDAKHTVQRWWRQEGEFTNSPFLVFHGAAGTGKTTVLNEMAQSLGCSYRFAAYAGKATAVLQRKGCAGAQTIHSLLYSPSNGSTAGLELLIKKLEADAKTMTEKERGELKREIYEEEKRASQPLFAVKDNPLQGLDLLVLDECSMIDQRMEDDILRCAKASGTRIIVAGDPWQLPPVRGTQGVFNARPDVLLTEVHRQALDSGILQVATRIRNRVKVRPGQYGSDCLVINRGGADNIQYALEADQILLGRNQTRHDTNTVVRRARGVPKGQDMPVVGDRLVCRQNNNKLGILNGTLWDVDGVSERLGDSINLDLSPADGFGVPVSLSAHARMLSDSPRELSENPISPKLKRKFEHFYYGNALTVHVSQGSEWGYVYLMEEYGANWDQWAWLYTGITRASKKLVVALV